MTADPDFDTGTAGDRTDDTYHNAGAGWEPIRGFDATFDGNEHAIANLFISRTSTSRVGLFGSTGAGAVIRNLALTDVNVTGKHNVGGLVGENQRQGRIIASYATGDASSAIAILHGHRRTAWRKGRQQYLRRHLLGGDGVRRRAGGRRFGRHQPERGDR